MLPLSKRSLMYAENLTLPPIQVIVLSANMGCSYCRDRISRLLSKITGLEEYTVDVSNRQVTVKGETKYKDMASSDSISTKSGKKKWKNDGHLFKFFVRLLRAAFIDRCCLFQSKE